MPPTTKRSQEQQEPVWPFWLWLATALSAILIVAIVGTAWAVRHILVAGGPRLSEVHSRILMSVAEFPGLVRIAVDELRSRIENEPLAFLIDRKAIEQPHWVRRFPAPEDSGYLLLSSVNAAAKHAIVQLIRISDGIPVGQWIPDWQAIIEQTSSKKFAFELTPNTSGAVHPLLLAGGDIVFNTGSSMVRLSPCNSKPVWVLDEVMHHSNELDASGSIWSPSVSQDGFADNTWFRDRIRDDALAHVSTDGRLLDKLSFSRILRENGLQALLLGTSRFNADPIHMNQIQVAQRDSPYWQRGDLLISARFLSTVFLYRPSSGKILWHQTGPWMNQHSVDFVNDHQISVFDNNTIANLPKEHAFLLPGDTNRVILYDFATKEVSQPFAALLAEARPMTITQGRARVLPDGGLFLEETENGRHLRFTRDRLLWSRVNDYDDKRIAALSWSRYLTADEARAPLQALAARKCSAVAVQ